MANYIKYGDIDVDQEAYLKAIADNAEAYLASRPWSEKQKNKWRNAYSDIVSQGITGASISTDGQNAGKWQINYNGNLSIDSMGKRDKETYQDAAYFLHSQMESLSKNNIRKQEETEKELPVFDNKTFTTGLHKQISNNIFGGSTWDTQKDWNIKDERDSTGKRGTQKRAELLAQELEKYRDSLEEGKYNFEGSPFTDLNDLKSRITDAVAALRTPDQNDDIDPLNRIGLKARDYLYDGLDDIYKQDDEGNTITYRDYVNFQNQQNLLRQQQQEQQQQQQQQQQQIEEEQKPNERAAIIADMKKKVKDYKDLVFNPSRENERQLIAKEKANNRKIFDEGLQFEDYARMGAMAQDIAGTVAAFIPGYGTATSGALGLTSLGTNMAADIADKSLSKWDIIKNAGVNLGLAAVGMVPGLGLASKSGKWITNIAKWAPRLLTLQAIKDLPDSYNSIQKAITNPKEVTNQDWKNIAYGLSVVAGLTRGTKGLANDRKFKPAFSQTTEEKVSVTTSKNRKIVLNDEQANKIKKLNLKDKEKANKELKDILKLSDDETVNISRPIIGKNKIITERENVPTGLSTRAQKYREWLENQNEIIKNNHPRLSKHFKTDYDIYKANTQTSFPTFGTNRFDNLRDKLKARWNPLSDESLQRKGIKITEETSKVTPTNTTSTNTTPTNTPVANTPSTNNTPTNNNVNLKVRNDAKFYRNTINEALNPKRSSKPLYAGTSGNIVVNGTNIKFNYSKNAKGDLELIIDKGGNISTHTIDKTRGSFHAKELVAKTIESARKESRNQHRQNKTKNDQKMSDFISQIKKLKKQGFLKHGGIIDNDNKLLNIIEDAWK